jgi:predicted dehydrogenase
MSTTHSIGIIMNGVTGRMGSNQHLARSIAAIREEGGTKLDNGDVIMPNPILVGRNEEKLQALAKQYGDFPYSTDLDSLLKDTAYPIYFDSQTTLRRVTDVTRAIEAGKHIYSEKPTATNSADAMKLYGIANKAGVKHGAVQDKLWLPGLLKLKHLIDTGFFGKILSVRGEFGYWVFDGNGQPAQRPSWNYRKEAGGGIILDMMPHWRYVIDNLFGEVRALTCTGKTHLETRWDESGKPYECTADDAAYATFRTDQGVICHFNSSWTVRVRRDDLFTMQVDGTKGSAVAGLRNCLAQSHENTPRPLWNPDIDNPSDFYDAWEAVLPDTEYDNAFKIQWELFLRHVIVDEPFHWDLKEAAKGVQLAEVSLESWKRGKWCDVPEL